MREWIRQGWTRGRLLRLGASAAFVYLAVLGVLLCLENRLLYPGATVSRAWLEPRSDLNARDVWLTAAEGQTIHAWFMPPPGWRPEQGAVLYSHENGSNLSKKQGNYRRWQLAPRRAALAYDYPGSGKT